MRVHDIGLVVIVNRPSNHFHDDAYDVHLFFTHQPDHPSIRRRCMVHREALHRRSLSIVGSKASRPPHIGVWCTLWGGDPLMIPSTVTIDAPEDAVAGDVVPCGGRIHKPLLACGSHQASSVEHSVEFTSAFALE